jgi:acetoin utilization deacetylase AcuC-like enzyme
MPPGSGDFEHCDALDRLVLPVMAAFDPGLVIVSAGQDGHVADPLSGQALTVDGFNAIASRAASFAEDRDIGLAAVHEGGYNPETLPALDGAILAGFGNYPADLSDPWSRTITGGLPPASAHSGWPERLEHIIETQRTFWAPAFG